MRCQKKKDSTNARMMKIFGAIRIVRVGVCQTRKACHDILFSASITTCIVHRASRIVNYASEPAHGCAFDKRVNDV